MYYIIYYVGFEIKEILFYINCTIVLILYTILNIYIKSKVVSRALIRETGK